MQKVYNTPLPVVENEVEQKENPKTNDETFITDVDMNVENWQTKETEFFTIKFPKEWYFFQTNYDTMGYNSYVITNNPNFDISKYPDISIGVGRIYPLDLMNETEIVISSNYLGDATANSGTSLDYIEYMINSMREYVGFTVACQYMSSMDSIPLATYCSFTDEDNKQRVGTYYASYPIRTFGFSARVKKENNMVLEKILEGIVQNYSVTVSYR